jgi:hypothetical protein
VVFGDGNDEVLMEYEYDELDWKNVLSGGEDDVSFDSLSDSDRSGKR